MNSFAVTERDIEVAKQMNASDHVIESLERGEWSYESDRIAVRYAELAIDYMAKTYSQKCRATFTHIPWLLKSDATVDLVVVGGEYDGSEVEVTISVKEPREYTDTWSAVVGASEFEQIVNSALSDALSDMPEGSWASQCHIVPMYTNEDHLGGNADIYISPSVISSEENLNQLRVKLENKFKETGVWIEIYLAVPSSDPPSGVMTVEHAVENALDDKKGIIYSAEGSVGFE